MNNINNINNNPLLKGIKENKNQETSVLRVNNNPLLKNVKNTINNDTKNVKNTSVLNTKVNAPKKVMNLAKSKNLENDKNFIDSAGYTLKSFGSGILSGSTGLAQAINTEIANNLEKGENSKKGVIETALSIMNPTKTQIDSILKSSSKIAHGIWKDEDKSIWEKIAGTVTTGIEGVGDVFTAPIDNTIQGIGALLPKDSNEKVLEFNKTISKPSKDLQEQLAKEYQTHKGGTRLAGDVANIVGVMVPSIATSAITKNPSAGLAIMGTSVKGMSTQEAMDKGVELNEAIAIGDTKAVIEVGTEMLTGGINIFGKGALDDIIEKGIDRKVKNEVANFFVQKGVGIAGEVLEETISDTLNTVIDKGTVDPEASYSLKDFGDTTLKTILSTTVINILTGGYGGSAYRENAIRLQNNTNEQEIIDAEVESRINKQQEELGRNLTTEEKNILKKQVSLLAMQSSENDITIEDQKIVNNVVDNKVNELKKSGKNLTNSELIKLRNQTVSELKSKNIIANTNVNNNSVQETSPIYGTQKQENPLKTIFEEKTKQVKTEISPVYTQNKSFVTTSNTLNALDSTSKTNSDTAPINNIIPQNQNFENTNPLLTTFEDKIRLKTQSEIEYNKSAKRYGIDTNNETVKSIFRVANERGIEVKYDAKAFSSTKQNAYWNDKKDSNREIVINPNADTNKALQSIIIHEILHDMEGTKEYNRLAKIVLEYAKEQGGYETALEDIKNIYSKFYDSNSKDFMKKIRHEMVADILGEKFGNQEFLNTLVKKDRTVMQKIHDFIIDLLNKLNSLTGYKYTKVYWQDVESKLRNAFNQEFVSENSKKYHVSKNLNDDIDKVLSNKYTLSNDVKLRDYTPEILVKSGIKDFPMLINQNHLKENILSITKAKKLGIYNKDANYHNLGKTLFMNAIDSLDDPLAIIKSISKSSKKNTYIIITDIQDKKGNQIIVPIYLQTKGNYNNIEIDTNKIKSIYGKTNVKDFVDRTIKENVNNVIYLTNDKNKRQLITTTGLQLSNNSNTVTTNTISQNTHKVNNLHNSKMSVSGNIINNKENGFYSQLERTITNKMQNSATADSVLNLIKNNGVKQDELNWTGIEEYLQEKGNEKVTKQEVLDYIKANQLELEEVELGDSKLRETTDPIKEDIASKKREIKEYLDKYHIPYELENGVDMLEGRGTYGDFMEDSLEKLVDFSNFEKDSDGTYYSTYTDGTTKFTYGFTEEQFKEDMQQLEALYDELNEAEMNLSMAEDEYGDDADEIGIPRYKAYKTNFDGGENYKELLYRIPSEVVESRGMNNYSSPHWQQSNILAHTRLQDYKDIEGNKVLFIEEIQSDLHQQGRREGYVSKEERINRKRLNDEIDNLRNENGNLALKKINFEKDVRQKLYDFYVEEEKHYAKLYSDYKDELLKEKKDNSEAFDELRGYYSESIDLKYEGKTYDHLGENSSNFSKEQVQKYIYLLSKLNEATRNRSELNDYYYGYITKEMSKELEKNKKYQEITTKLEDIENQLEVKTKERNTINEGVQEELPFKKNWHEFVLRKVINEAVQKGYDKVAWTTGKQQSDRYDLAQFVDEIQYHAYLDDKSNDGKFIYNINVYKDDSRVITREGIDGNELKELLGKDIATKIINSDSYDGTIEGENLSVGGEGMRGFYDKIIPEYLSKYLKKWNSKIETVQIGDNAQQGFTITPEMKESIQITGQPIFSLNNGKTWENFLKEKFSNNGTKQTIKDVKLPNLYAIKSIQKRNSIVENSTWSMVAPLKNEVSYNSESSVTESITQNNSKVNDLHKKDALELNESTKKYSVSDEEKYITLDDGNRYMLEDYKNVFGASEEAFNTIYNMQNKLPKTNLYQELKKKYAKEDYDNSIVEKAKVEVPANYQGRRTKIQWLSIAQKIGKNIEKEDIEKIAYHSWINERPNNKENLNRQGQKFVKFTLEEWLDNIQKGYEYRPIPNLPDIKTKSTKKSDKNQPKWIETSFSNEQIRKNINKSKFDDVTYIVQGNETTINRVNRKLEDLSYEEAVREIDNAFNRHDNGKFAEIKGNNYTNFSLDECVMAQRLLQIAIDRQDIKTAESLISQIALAGTRAGQSIQALSLINRLSPEGQLLHLQRSTERLENQIKHKMKTKEAEEKFTEETHKRAKEVTDKIQNKLIQYTKENSKHFSNLAKKLANKISDKVDIKEQITNNNIQNEIVKELYKLALESPIDIEKRMKANNMTAIDKIKLALENKEVYGETWNQAKRILLKKYKHDAEIIIKLTNFFEKGIIPDYSMTTFKEAYEKTLNETGYKTKKAIIKTLTDEAKQKVEYINNLRPDQQKDIIKKVAQTIIDETGAKGNDANILAEQVVIEFFDSLKDNNIAELSKTVSKFKGIEITEEMKRKILSAKNIDKLNEIMDEVREEIAKQIPSTLSDKIRSWRYFSMLFNPQTHIRNIIGNMSMRIVANGKKVVARGLETVFDKEIEERTRTFEKVSDEIKKFAKDDVNKMMDTLTGENKLSMENKIMQKRKIFKNDKLDKLVKFNSELLEKEDMLALKTSYINNFAEYLTANKIRTNEDIENNKELVEKGRIFATQEALKSTFRSNSNLANLLQQMENRLGISGQVLIGGLIPFKKTPINITKTAGRYSPLGLLESIIYESSRLKKGEITTTEYIDKISSGLTGTGLAVLGMILFNAGVITAGSDDEKDEKYKQQLGWKPYAVRIGNTYYSLSWLSPTAIPLFFGAELSNLINEEGKLDIGTIVEGLGDTLNPLMDMSMLQGINDALSSYNSNGLLGNIGNVAKTTAENYALQFIPTLSSKIASLTDNVVRTTTPSKNSEFKELESLGRRAMNKIPVLRNILEPKKDIWGEDVKNSENIVTRFIENFVLPTYGSKYTESEVDEAILQLYSKTGDDSIIPTVPNSYFTSDGNKYELSAKEYTQYKETYGKNLNSKIKTIITSDAYKKLSDEQKVDIVSSVFKYASEEAKKEYLTGQDIEYSYSSTHMLYNLSEKFLDDNSTFKSLYYETKDTEALPIDILNTFTYQNIKFKVTNEEKQSYAEDSYKVLSKIYSKLNNNSKFRKMSNESKIKILKEISSKYLSTLKKKYRLQVIKRAIKNKEYEIAK